MKQIILYIIILFISINCSTNKLTPKDNFSLFISSIINKNSQKTISFLTNRSIISLHSNLENMFSDFEKNFSLDDSINKYYEIEYNNYIRLSKKDQLIILLDIAMQFDQYPEKMTYIYKYEIINNNTAELFIMIDNKFELIPFVLINNLWKIDKEF